MQAAGPLIGVVILASLLAGCTMPSEPDPVGGVQASPPRTPPAPDAQATEAPNLTDDKGSSPNPPPDPSPANEAHAGAMTLSDDSWVIDRFELYQAAGADDKIRDKDERPNPMTPWLLVIEARSEEDGDRRFCWGWDDQYECEWFDASKPLKLYRKPNSAGYMAVGDHVVFGGAQWTAVTVYPIPGVGETIEIPGMAAITLESYAYDTRQGTLLIVPNGTASYHASNRHGSSCSTASETVEELPEGRRLHFWCDETSDGSQHILLRYFDNDRSRAIWAFRWTIDPPA